MWKPSLFHIRREKWSDFRVSTSVFLSALLRMTDLARQFKKISENKICLLFKNIFNCNEWSHSLLITKLQKHGQYRSSEIHCSFFIYTRGTLKSLERKIQSKTSSRALENNASSDWSDLRAGVVKTNQIKNILYTPWITKLCFAEHICLLQSSTILLLLTHGKHSQVFSHIFCMLLICNNGLLKTSKYLHSSSTFTDSITFWKSDHSWTPRPSFSLRTGLKQCKEILQISTFQAEEHLVQTIYIFF